MRTITDEKGVALITALFFLVIVTALATGALMLATVQVQVAGGMSRWERAYAAAEGCEDYVYPLLVGLHFDNRVPTEYSAYSGSYLVGEISSGLTNDKDASNLVCHIGAYDVNVDIDVLGSITVSGSSIGVSEKYSRAGAVGATMTVYRITSAATTADGRVNAVLNQSVFLKPMND